MTKGRVIALLSILVLILLAVSAVDFVTTDKKAPVIKIPAEQVLYVEGADDGVLLKNVTATDSRDGDVTNSIRVGDVLPTADGTQAVVIYTAKDSHNNIATLTRVVDYESAPEEPVTEVPAETEEAA